MGKTIEKNRMAAIEPSIESVDNRWKENKYEQIVGSIDELRKLDDESFDMIFCHNVLEYASDRKEIVKEFYRLLRPGGVLSIVKHNRPGRVMLEMVLHNNFENANSLLDGTEEIISKFGTIHYYKDDDILKWCNGLNILKVYGIRTFWDLQHNQEIENDAKWQEKMIQIEMKVSEIEEYRGIAFFHHLFFIKRVEEKNYE